MKANQIFEGTVKKVNDFDMDSLIEILQNQPPEYFVYETIYLNGQFFVIESHTSIIVFSSKNESEADDICDQFNHDKDTGKDALVYSLNKNKEIYSL